jgi:hypothetical protein
LQGDHVRPFLFRNSTNRGTAESRGQQSVVARWLPATLKVTERQRPAFFAGANLDLDRETLAHAAELNPSCRRHSERLLSTLGICALCHDNDGEVPAGPVTRCDLVAHFIDVVGDLWYENHIGRAGEPRVQRNETRLPPHYFHHDHTVV